MSALINACHCEEALRADVAIRLPLPSPTGKVPAVAGG